MVVEKRKELKHKETMAFDDFISQYYIYSKYLFLASTAVHIMYGNKEFKKRGLIFGIISRNMVVKYGNHSSTHIKNIPCIEKGFFVDNWILMINGTIFHPMQTKDFTPKYIKTLLINESAMTLRDLQAIQESEIPRKTFHNLEIKIEKVKILFSVFPSKIPTPLFNERVFSEEMIGTERVFWSTCACCEENEEVTKDKKEDALSLNFLCSHILEYQDFLMFFCKNHLGTNKCSIEFELFIFNNPIIFGKATCVRLVGNAIKNSSFYFSRLLNCSEVKDVYLASQH